MDKLIYTVIAFVIGIWLWMEYFREIPHLAQQGVLNNFKVETIEPLQLQAMVLDKQFVRPARRTIHPASPVVDSFDDLAYLSNVDVLLSTSTLPNLNGKLLFDDEKRCFKFEGTLDLSEQNWLQQHVQQLSLIAVNKEVSKVMRRLKTGQSVTFIGDFVNARSAKTSTVYAVGQTSTYAASCRLFRVTQIVIH